MGPLIFIARTHQIKRKKSRLSLRLMQISSQRQQLADQISHAQQQQTFNQNTRKMFDSFRMRQFQNEVFQAMFLGRQFMLNKSEKGLQAIQNDKKHSDADKQIAMMKYRSQMDYDIQLSTMMASQFMNQQMQTYQMFNSMINQIEGGNDAAELERLNAIDAQLEQEQTGIENQLKMLQAEEQAVEKQMDQEIKQSAPKFGFSG